MYCVLLMLLLVSTVHSQTPNQTLLDSIFRRPSVTNVDTDYEECNLMDGRKGECVNFYRCTTATKTNITEGTIDLHVKDGVCESYIDICCDRSDIRPSTDPIIPISAGEQKREGCGWRNPEGAVYQPGGEVDGGTKFGEFPWVCALLKSAIVNDSMVNVKNLHVYIGGGSLIHPSVVLTAAHSVAKEQKIHARAGEWDTQTIKEIYPFQDRDVASIVIHEDFNSGHLFYDIAVLFLSEPMELVPNVGVACLPPPREITSEGTRCFATGWGKDKFGKEGRYQVILKKGDKDRFMQNGIVAWGIGCAMQGVPGVYVDVANLRDWIDDKVAGKGYDPRVYTY